MNRYPSILVLVALLVILSVNRCPAQKHSVVSMNSSVRAFIGDLDTLLPPLMKEFQVPGAAVAVVHEGHIVYRKGLGVTSVGDSMPVSTGTILNVGSISKAVTTWAVLKLVSDGLLDLDAPVTKYLTRWQLPPSEFDADSVTARRLLSHSAGLSLEGYPGFEPDQELPSLEESLSGATNGAGAVEVIYEPGTIAAYSGGGFTLLQLIIEEITHRSFAEYVRDEVLLPLGMSRSTFNQEPLSEIAPPSASPHGDFKVIPRRRFTALAAAGLYTTLDDMLKFVMAEMALPNDAWHTEPLLSRQMVEMMEIPNAPARYYGLGHQIRPSGDQVAVGHVGSNRGWQAHYEFLRGTGDAFIILTNSGGGFTLHNSLVCDWLRASTGVWHAEFCETAQSSRLFDLIEEYTALVDTNAAPTSTELKALTLLRDAKVYLNGPDDKVTPVVEGLRAFADLMEQSNLAPQVKSEAGSFAKRARGIALDLGSMEFDK